MLRRFALALLLASGLAGCISNVGAFEITLADAPAAVTDGSGEALCQLTIDSGDPIALTSIQVWLRPPGGTVSLMPYTHEDNDGDGMLSTGDVLIVNEPPVNLVGTADIGTEYVVEILEDVGPMRVSSLWEGVWTAT